jgi:hypothetical protein
VRSRDIWTIGRMNKRRTKPGVGLQAYATNV